ncbi:hypothetical protein AVEN_72219-1 [Araneus ventricosus]|uniref:Uncharacterized protein n=1 Tax=Araneus ventricosus TaxID=182803 RepID=A0A4Y2LIK6_ARAVE|nr:hypothetical protein AVEN_72219-1 [Araneus ventricosus]
MTITSPGACAKARRVSESAAEQHTSPFVNNKSFFLLFRSTAGEFTLTAERCFPLAQYRFEMDAELKYCVDQFDEANFAVSVRRIESIFVAKNLDKFLNATRTVAAKMSASGESGRGGYGAAVLSELNQNS